MTTTVWTERIETRPFADTALKGATRLWFGVAAIGQLLFAAYLGIGYGRPALQGRFADWNHVMRHGYVPGQTGNNIAVGVHLLAAFLLTLGGLLQFVPQVRERFPRFHRGTGRIYVLAAVLTSLAGLWMLWFRGKTPGDFVQHVGLTLDALLIVLFAIFALRAAIARRIAVHRRWAMRLFLVVSASWFYRVMFLAWIVLNHGPAGFNPKTFTGPFLTFMAFAEWLLPLAMFELYLLAQRHAGALRRYAMATLLVLLTAYMTVGIFAVTMAMWLPVFRTGRRF